MPNPSNSFCLSVGVGRRPTEAGDPELDVEAFAITATDAGYIKTALVSYFKMPDENIEVLANETARKDNIVTALQGLSKKTKANKADLVVIYFSGHGCKIGDEYFLVTNDSKKNNIPEKGINGNLFTTLLNDNNADKMLVLLD